MGIGAAAFIPMAWHSDAGWSGEDSTKVEDFWEASENAAQSSPQG
jgi:hypothetical protein